MIDIISKVYSFFFSFEKSITKSAPKVNDTNANFPVFVNNKMNS